ncbi:MAG: SufD family Fe-S cluster assembly protein [Patescibacteria group bacterium]
MNHQTPTTPSPLLPSAKLGKGRPEGAEGRIIIDTLTEPAKRIEVQAGEKLTYIVPVLQSVTEPRHREIVLAGEGAEVEIVGLFLGYSEATLALQIDTIHAAPNTRGNTIFKAVLAGKSSLEFYGMIKIMKDAQNSNDFLQQDSLLLSQDAKANAVPGLEIEANDVKASHGATAKPVDPEQKFYLMSRGLSEEQAEAMVVTGFLALILKAIPNVEWKRKISYAVDQLL